MDGPQSSDAHHTIRLRGPWDYQFLVDGQMVSSAGRSELDVDWSTVLGPERTGILRLIRRFSQPTNLDPDEEVWLVFELLHADVHYSLNGYELGRNTSLSQFALTVGGLLNFRNELVVELVWPFAVETRGNPLGEVRLEMRRKESL